MNRSNVITRAALFLALLLIALPVLAQDGAIPLVPINAASLGFASVAPEGWMPAGEGVYQRMASETDLVALIQQSAPGFSAEDVATGLIYQLGLAEVPEPETTLEADVLAWQVYRLTIETAQAGMVVVDLAVAEEPLAAHMILLQSPEAERDALYEGVFLPALAAYAPYAANWGQPEGPAPIPAEFTPPLLRPEVLDTRPHDPTSFTQGLLLHDGSLYESDGNCCPSYSTYSTLREVDPLTGEVIRSIDLDPQYFAEGLERVDDRLIQLTWQEGVAFVYDIATLEQVDTLEYTGEGWGLCYDGSLLYMSDGSPYITLRDPQTFEVVDRGLVTLMGTPVQNINELECVGDLIYANIWQEDYIIQIDKTNGNVVGVIDASGLLSEEAQATIAAGSEVLNGIVYQPESETFLITGKHWPNLFEVTFVEAETE